MTDQEWEEFLKWYKEKYPMTAPRRTDIELYLKFVIEKNYKEG